MLAFLETNATLLEVKKWTTYCTKRAILSHQKGVSFPFQPFFPQSSELISDFPVSFDRRSLKPQGRGSRRRRSLTPQVPGKHTYFGRQKRSQLPTHGPGQNKWLRFAQFTANKTGVDTPCWVCSFRPHHSQDNPTSVTVPLDLTESMCILHQWNLGY